jgi:hypothetical protein
VLALYEEVTSYRRIPKSDKASNKLYSRLKYPYYLGQSRTSEKKRVAWRTKLECWPMTRTTLCRAHCSSQSTTHGHLPSSSTLQPSPLSLLAPFVPKVWPRNPTPPLSIAITCTHHIRSPRTSPFSTVARARMKPYSQGHGSVRRTSSPKRSKFSACGARLNGLPDF